MCDIAGLLLDLDLRILWIYTPPLPCTTQVYELRATRQATGPGTLPGLHLAHPLQRTAVRSKESETVLGGRVHLSLTRRCRVIHNLTSNQHTAFIKIGEWEPRLPVHIGERKAQATGAMAGMPEPVGGGMGERPSRKS